MRIYRTGHIIPGQNKISLTNQFRDIDMEGTPLIKASLAPATTPEENLAEFQIRNKVKKEIQPEGGRRKQNMHMFNEEIYWLKYNMDR